MLFESNPRFWSRVDSSGGPATCWPWQRCRIREGYGRTSRNGRLWLAHRVAWTIVYGPIPDGLLVLHTCDNPPCCNPDHLWLGDDTSNNLDKEQKRRGNHPSGASHGRSRLTIAQVLDIRALYESHALTQPELALHFGVGQATISRVIRRANWAHV